MTNMIWRLWNEELDLYKHSAQEDSELKESEGLIENNLKILRELVDKKAEERLERYNDCINEYIYLSEKRAFCDGFSLGVRLMAEAFGNTESK